MNEQQETIHLKLVSIVTEYDMKQASKRYHNPYALGHYLNAVRKIDTYVSQGHDLRLAIINCFVGRLCDLVLKKMGLNTLSKDEDMGNYQALPEIETPA